ncbi:MAG: RecB family exonuclease, partial [Chloroflexota bacterium]
QGSEFWDLVVGSDLSVNLGEEECPADNPNRAPALPGEDAPPEDGAADEAMELLTSGRDPAAWLEAVAAREGQGRWTVLRAEADEHLSEVGLPVVAVPVPSEVEVSCSGLILHLTCPRRYRYVYVDGLPVRPSPYAALGREVHRQIEELSRPSATPILAEAPADNPDDTTERDLRHEVEELVASQYQESPAGPSGRASVGELIARFQASAYGRRPATYVELPFQLPLAGGVVRGRLDRLDRLPDGRWELVDFKSGRSHPESLPAYRLQLNVYALAVCALFGARPDQLDARILFLGDGSVVPVPLGEDGLETARAVAGQAIRGIAAQDYGLCPDASACQGCDYAHLCLRAE